MTICGEGHDYITVEGALVSDFNKYSGIFWKMKCQRLVCTKIIIY